MKKILIRKKTFDSPDYTISNSDYGRGARDMSKLAFNTYTNEFGEDLSEIINQDGDDKTDGKVIDQIVEYLKELGIYKPRK